MQMLGDETKQAEAAIEARAKEKAVLTAKLLDIEAQVQNDSAAICPAFSSPVVIRELYTVEQVFGDQCSATKIKFCFLSTITTCAGEQLGAGAAAGHRSDSFPLVRYELLVTNWVTNHVQAQI